MTLFDKQLDSVVQADLQALIDSQLRESKRIDYKRELPKNGSDDKKEFLNDVSSFANAQGGLLIYGMSEQAGIPTGIEGIQMADPDAETLRLQNMMRDSIAPRIPGIATHPVLLENGKHCIIVKIPQSWMRPHMVSLGSSKFYSRNSNGKQPMDIAEIRTAFELSGSAQERIINFKADRLGNLIAGTAPVQLEEGPKTVLHLVPISASDPTTGFDVSRIEEGIGRRQHMFVEPGSSRGRYNFDGYLSYTTPPRETTSCAYVQVFRNGSIEAVESWVIGGLKHMEGVKYIAIVSYEDHLLKALPMLLEHQRQLGVEPPIILMLSLVGGIKGYAIEPTQGERRMPWYKAEDQMIDRDPLLLPEVIIDSYDIEPDKVMRPILDALWNASGYPHCRNYDASGRWVVPRHS